MAKHWDSFLSHCIYVPNSWASLASLPSCRPPSVGSSCALTSGLLKHPQIWVPLANSPVTQQRYSCSTQIFVHWMVCGHFDAHHHQCLLKISLLPGFASSILPGISVACMHGAPGIASKVNKGCGNNGIEDDDEQEEEEEDKKEWIEFTLQAADDMIDIMITVNNTKLTSDRP